MDRDAVRDGALLSDPGDLPGAGGGGGRVGPPPAVAVRRRVTLGVQGPEYLGDRHRGPVGAGRDRRDDARVGDEVGQVPLGQAAEGDDRHARHMFEQVGQCLVRAVGHDEPGSLRPAGHREDQAEARGIDPLKIIDNDCPFPGDEATGGLDDERVAGPRIEVAGRLVELREKVGQRRAKPVRQGRQGRVPVGQDGPQQAAGQ